MTKTDLTQQLKHAMNKLKSRKNIIIKPTDKSGGQTIQEEKTRI